MTVRAKVNQLMAMEAPHKRVDTTHQAAHTIQRQMKTRIQSGARTITTGDLTFPQCVDSKMNNRTIIPTTILTATIPEDDQLAAAVLVAKLLEQMLQHINKPQLNKTSTLTMTCSGQTILTSK